MLFDGLFFCIFMVGKLHVVLLCLTLRIFSFGRRDRKFKVAIKLASRPDLHQLQEFLRRKQRDAPYETIQVLDVVFRDLPSQKYVKSLNIYSIGLNIDCIAFSSGMFPLGGLSSTRVWEGGVSLLMVLSTGAGISKVSDSLRWDCLLTLVRTYQNFFFLSCCGWFC